MHTMTRRRLQPARGLRSSWSTGCDATVASEAAPRTVPASPPANNDCGEDAAGASVPRSSPLLRASSLLIAHFTSSLPQVAHERLPGERRREIAAEVEPLSTRPARPPLSTSSEPYRRPQNCHGAHPRRARERRESARIGGVFRDRIGSLSRMCQIVRYLQRASTVL